MCFGSTVFQQQINRVNVFSQDCQTQRRIYLFDMIGRGNRIRYHERIIWRDTTFEDSFQLNFVSVEERG